MKNATLLALLISFGVTSVQANSIHISPALKLSDFHGGEIQLGITDVGAFDALYLNYGNSRYKTDRYDERVQFYRIGFQHEFADRLNEGFQAEIGIATYDGAKYSSSGTESLDQLGVSVGGAYVYKIAPSFGVRLGLDYSYFSQQETHMFGDSLLNINVGIISQF